MSSQIVTILFFSGIAGLFALNRNPRARTSPALWLSVVWLILAASRSVSQWLAAFGYGNATPSTAADYMDGSPLDRNVSIAMMVVAIIVLAGRRYKVGQILRANWAVCLYFSYCLASVLWSDYPEVAVRRWIKALCDLMMVMIVLTEKDRVTATKRLFAYTGFLLMPLSILFIKYYGNLGREYRPDFGNWVVSYIGVTTSKNMLGMITLIVGVGCVWTVLQLLRDKKMYRRKSQLIAQGALLAVVLWLLAITHSMTSLSCFMMATVLMVVASLPRLSRPVVIHGMVFSMLLVAFCTLFLNLGSILLESLGRDPTLTGRTEIWGLVLGMAGSPLVGTGFESYWLGKRLQTMWSLYWWHPNEAHNGYLEVYLTLGYFGLTILGLVLIAAYRGAVQELRRSPDTARLRLALYVVVLTYNFTESAMRTMNPIWICFLLTMITVPAMQLRSGKKAKTSGVVTFSPQAIPCLEEI